MSAQSNDEQMIEAKKSIDQRFSKQQLIDMIIRQNQILNNQSEQLLELVEVNNMINEESLKNESVKNESLLAINNKCGKANDMRKKQVMIYERSIKIQMVLFFLFLLVICWFIYSYSNEDKNSQIRSADLTSI
jgi:predicted PP-loop superfamily ATPase